MTRTVSPTRSGDRSGFRSARHLMSHGVFTAVSGAVSRMHWSLRVLAVFGAGRLVSTAILLVAATRQGPSPWSGPAPDYGTFISYWDSGWYERIFAEGYPAELPRDADGEVGRNAWAFLPLYPEVVRLLHLITGAGWDVLAPTVSVVAAAGASLVLYRLFLETADARTALGAVALVSFAPVSAVLQIPYAESLHLLLLAGALHLVVSGRYFLAVPVVVLMSLARPTGVPFAILLGILVLQLLVRAHRERGSADGAARRRDLGALMLLAGVTSLAALAWPAAAWWRTGEPDAYVATETAWREGSLVPFLPWFERTAGVVGPVAAGLTLAGLVVVVVLLALTPAVRSIGPVLGAWCVAYLLYLAMFWDPQSSTWRILLPLFPLAAALAGPRSGRLLWVLLPASVLLQFLWVDELWGWTPSVPGGDHPP